MFNLNIICVGTSLKLHKINCKTNIKKINFRVFGKLEKKNENKTPSSRCKHGIFLEADKDNIHR